MVGAGSEQGYLEKTRRTKKRLDKIEAPFMSKALFECLEKPDNLSPSIFKYELPKAIKV